MFDILTRLFIRVYNNYGTNLECIKYIYRIPNEKNNKTILDIRIKKKKKKKNSTIITFKREFMISYISE